MAELADAHDSGSCGATHAGSSPVIRTIPSVLTELERFCMTLGFLLPLFNLHKRQNEHLRPVLYVPKHCFRVAFQGRVFQYFLCNYNEL